MIKFVLVRLLAMPRVFLFSAALLAVLQYIAPLHLQAEIIISEIMYNPQGTDLDTTVTPNLSREWGEIYNTGATPIDISGWQYGDAQDGEWSSAFPAGTTLGRIRRWW